MVAVKITKMLKLFLIFFFFFNEAEAANSLPTFVVVHCFGVFPKSVKYFKAMC